MKICHNLYLVLLLVAYPSISSASSVKFVGTAYEPETDQILYTEHHELTMSLDGLIVRSSVKYYSPTNQLIAEKTLGYSDLLTMPELDFIDHRTETKYQTSNIRHESALNVLLQYSSSEGKGRKVLDVSRSKPSVTDAGFEMLVANKWRDLREGKRVDFQFLALSRAEYFDFELSKQSVDDEILVLKLEPSSWLISLLMDPILLTYELSSRRLLKFEGLTNIEEMIEGQVTGKNFSARIEYRYLDDDLAAGASL